MEEISNGNESNPNNQFEQAALNFMDAFSNVPYEELTDEQKEIADQIKAYIEEKHPGRTTLH